MPAVWFRFRASLRRRWAATLALALLIGLAGGLTGLGAPGRRRRYGVGAGRAVARVALVGLATLLVANAVAFIPGRMAARTRAAVALRSE